MQKLQVLPKRKSLQLISALSMRLKSLLVLALLLSLSSACQNMALHDYPLTIQLPGTKQCYTYHVLSGRADLLTVQQCEDLKLRAIYLTSDAWLLIKEDLQVNCQNDQCTQLQGAFDGVFISIDQALQKVPFQ